MKTSSKIIRALDELIKPRHTVSAKADILLEGIPVTHKYEHDKFQMET